MEAIGKEGIKEIDMGRVERGKSVVLKPNRYIDAGLFSVSILYAKGFFWLLEGDISRKKSRPEFFRVLQLHVVVSCVELKQPFTP